MIDEVAANFGMIGVNEGEQSNYQVDLNNIIFASKMTVSHTGDDLTMLTMTMTPV